MSILDMDVTPRRHAGYIRSREFATLRKGYDPDQVRQFLDQVATWFSEMEENLADARAAEARALAQPPPAPEPAPAAHTADGTPVVGADDPYAMLGARVAEVLRTAEEHATQIRAEAEGSVHQMLDHARLETASLRHAAQEEADAVRQSAREQAEATRQSAQDDADRVRDEAARALETARVEAERTVAGLTERRTVLTAELHAARSRLLGIVSQLEEEVAEEDVAEDPVDVYRTEPSEEADSSSVGSLGGGWEKVSAGSIRADDPRLDPIPADIPPFVPPPPPRRDPLPSALAADAAPRMEGPPETEMFIPLPAEAPAAADEQWAGEDADEGLVDPAPVERPSADAEVEALIEKMSEPAPEEPPVNVMGSLWTPEETEGQGPDLSLPDFPSIDIPSLESDQDRRQ